jgi:hypothetical protein
MGEVSEAYQLLKSEDEDIKAKTFAAIDVDIAAKLDCKDLQLSVASRMKQGVEQLNRIVRTLPLFHLILTFL